MVNSSRQTIYYTPRLTDEQAYELLPTLLKRKMQQAVSELDSYSLLRYYRKHGIQAACLWVDNANVYFASRPWIGDKRSKFMVSSTYPNVHYLEDINLYWIGN